MQVLPAWQPGLRRFLATCLAHGALGLSSTACQDKPLLKCTIWQDCELCGCVQEGRLGGANDQHRAGHSPARAGAYSCDARIAPMLERQKSGQG